MKLFIQRNYLTNGISPRAKQGLRCKATKHSTNIMMPFLLFFLTQHLYLFYIFGECLYRPRGWCPLQRWRGTGPQGNSWPSQPSNYIKNKPTTKNFQQNKSVKRNIKCLQYQHQKQALFKMGNHICICQI